MLHREKFERDNCG
jgi:hypothetical protein